MVSRKDRNIPFFAGLAILLFAVLSYTPFLILGDFAFCLAFLIILLFIVHRKKAILPSVITIFAGFGMIALFDSDRAFRMINFWNVIFERPALLQGPMPFPQLLNMIGSYFLTLVGIFQFQRFAVLLFIPQSLLILYLIRMNQKSAVPFSISLVLLTTLSIFISFSELKRPCIDDQAFRDLQNIKKYIFEDKKNTIIIARHGIEFWTAWTLNVKVGNDRSMDKLGLKKYKNIIFLQQKNEERQGPSGRRSLRKPGPGEGGPPPMGPPIGPPMGRPVPENFNLIYSSSYFNAYQKLN